MQATQLSSTRGGACAVKGRVLLVEDDEASREAMRIVLEDAGFEVEVADDGAGAVMLARRLNPHVVLLDLVLPGVNGFEAARELKRNEETAAIPLVAVTASWLGSDVDRLRGAGFDAALRKPFPISDLIDQVARLLPN